MEWLGVRLDKAANAANAQSITTADSETIVFVVRTNEERMIAEHAVNVAGLAAQLAVGGALIRRGGEFRLQRAIEAGETLARGGEGVDERRVGLGRRRRSAGLCRSSPAPRRSPREAPAAPRRTPARLRRPGGA